MISSHGGQLQPVDGNGENVAVPQIPAKWVLLLKSRKFWAAVVALGLVIFRAYQPDFPVSDENMTKIVLVLIAYIVGTALERPVVTKSQGDASRSQGDASR
jgi:hypothetical protein